MPLLDHFHPPLSRHRHWENLHSAWANALRDQANPEDAVESSQRLVDQGCYALRVKGQSMIEDHIDDGDIVIIHPQANADDGDTVVALITSSGVPEGEATLKKVYREGARVRLQPANATMEPIYVQPRDLQIQGKVVSIVKNF